MPVCTKCLKVKKVKEFQIRKRKNKYGITTFRVKQCKKCLYIYCNTWEIKAKSTIEGYLKSLLRAVKTRAKRNKQVYNINLEFLVNLYNKQTGKCALSKEQMTISARKGHIDTNISVDRIDSSKGYIKGNVQLVCDIVNRMKRNLTDIQFKIWCKRIST